MTQLSLDEKCFQFQESPELGGRWRSPVRVEWWEIP